MNAALLKNDLKFIKKLFGVLMETDDSNHVETGATLGTNDPEVIVKNNPPPLKEASSGFGLAFAV